MKSFLRVLFAFTVLALLSPLTRDVASAEEAKDAAETNSNTVQLLAGEQKTLDVSNIKRVAIGDPQVADVKVLADTGELLITGLSAGETSLAIWDKDNQQQNMVIKVVAKDPKVIKKEVQELMKDIEGLEIKIVGDRVYIDGEVYREGDLDRAKAVAKVYPQVTVLAVYSKSYIKSKRMIMVDYNLFQVTKTDILSMGVNWEEALNRLSSTVNFRKLIGGGDPYQSGQTTSTGTGSTTNPTYTPWAWGGDVLLTASFNPISFNQTDGRIRFLENHQTVVKSGEEAEYFYGGEYPYITITPSAGFAFQTITFKPFGAIFKVTPEIDKVDLIDVTLDTELSRIDTSIGTAQYPGIARVKNRSKVNLKTGQTIMIGGFHSQQISKLASGLPGLSQIPVLGYFFGNKNFTDNKADGVVFITPSVIAPAENAKDYPQVKAVMDKYEPKDFKL